MKILALIFIMFAVIFSGCTVKIDEFEIKQMVEQCESRGGIDYINTIDIAARCKDGFYAETETIP